MRRTFINTLTELAEQDSRILLLTGDLGYTVIEPFVERFPHRFFNAGVAEQNMVGVATGLAEAGFIPFVYSIATFASLRAYEFIRNGPVLHKLPVRIIGVGGGFEYGVGGITHHALEDVGVMRLQPDLALITPADYTQTRTALLKTYDLPGPIYYRLGKDDQNTVPGLNGRFELGRAQFIHQGNDLLLITMGNMAIETIDALELLAAQGINSTLIVVASLNPAPIEDLVATLSDHSLALTIESHYTIGGLGSLVSEIVAERKLGCQIIRLGVRHLREDVSGGEGYLRHQYRLSSQAIVETAHQALVGVTS